ncbi:hypothetical protein [Caulobacter sp. DWR2-3-1b2]|uniref:hypothetical protein n=1 Tax=unclassified Caulobacter TaxID=2648921 RepID=UPI003CE8F6A5
MGIEDVVVGAVHLQDASGRMRGAIASDLLAEPLQLRRLVGELGELGGYRGGRGTGYGEDGEDWNSGDGGEFLHVVASHWLRKRRGRGGCQSFRQPPTPLGRSLDVRRQVSQILGQNFVVDAGGVLLGPEPRRLQLVAQIREVDLDVGGVGRGVALRVECIGAGRVGYARAETLSGKCRATPPISAPPNDQPASAAF